MTLGDMIEELELLAKHYTLETPVRMFEFTRSGDARYPDVESVEYSTANDAVVIW